MPTLAVIDTMFAHDVADDAICYVADRLTPHTVSCELLHRWLAEAGCTPGHCLRVRNALNERLNLLPPVPVLTPPVVAPVEPTMPFRDLVSAGAPQALLDAVKSKAYARIAGMDLQGTPLDVLQCLMIKYSDLVDVQLACLEAMTSCTWVWAFRC